VRPVWPKHPAAPRASNPCANNPEGRQLQKYTLVRGIVIVCCYRSQIVAKPFVVYRIVLLRIWIVNKQKR
jgi:hypothetical protein